MKTKKGLFVMGAALNLVLMTITLLIWGATDTAISVATVTSLILVIGYGLYYWRKDYSIDFKTTFFGFLGLTSVTAITLLLLWI